MKNTLDTVIEHILRTTSEIKIPWAFTGGTALYLRGLNVDHKNDIDISTTKEGAEAFAKSFVNYQPATVQSRDVSPFPCHRSYFTSFKIDDFAIEILGDYQFRKDETANWSTPHINQGKIKFVNYKEMLVPVVDIDTELAYYQTLEQTPAVQAKVAVIQEALSTLKEKEELYEDLIKKTIDAYNHAAPAYDAIVSGNNYLPLKDRINSFGTLIKTHPRVLDMGCGPGQHSILFANQGFIVDAVDFSEKMLERAQINANRAGHNISFFHKNIVDLNLETESYDIVFSSAVLFHIPSMKMEGVVKNIHRMLRKNGIVFITVQHGNGSEVRHEKKYDNEIQRYFNYFSLEGLQGLFERTGFTIEETDVLPGQHGHTWIHLLARK